MKKEKSKRKKKNVQDEVACKEIKNEETNEEEILKNNDNNEVRGKKVFEKEKVLLFSFGCFICFLLLLLLANFLFVPKIEFNGQEEVSVLVFDEYREQGAKAMLAGKEIDSLEIIGEVDTSKVGEYEVIYKVKNGPFTAKRKKKVIVVDKEKPTITLVGDEKITLCPLAKFVETGYSAFDNYDGDLTKNVIVDEKEDGLGVTYSVKDSSGNEYSLVREIERKDSKSPEITLKGAKSISIEVGKKYTEYGVSVLDDCDNDLLEKVVITNNVDTSKKGSYKVVYQVTDNAGNTSKVERSVKVVDKVKVNSPVPGVIYLTFDDGPSATVTGKILDILKVKNVKATFFVINQADSLNYLIKREFNEGHTVALHSYTHNYSYIYSSEDNYFSDLKKIQDKVEKITGEKSMIIRFPGGGSNTVSRKYKKGIMTTLTKSVKDQGYHYFDWNVSSGDAGGAKNSQDVYKNVVNNLSKKRANVVLLHDFESNYKTLNALSDIIDYGLKNGYEFRAIDMSTAMVVHGVNN